MMDQTEALIREVTEYLRSIRVAIGQGDTGIHIKASIRGDRIRVTGSVKQGG